MAYAVKAGSSKNLWFDIPNRTLGRKDMDEWPNITYNMKRTADGGLNRVNNLQ